MGNLVLTNLNLATMVPVADDPCGLIEDAVVEISDGLIAYAGPRTGFAGDLADATSMDGRLALPGFVACHNTVCWAPGVDAPERLSAQDYRDFVQAVATATSAADDQNLLASMRRRLAKLARSGVTAFELKSGFGRTPRDEFRLALVCRRLQAEMPNLSRVTLFAGHFIARDRDPDDHLADIEAGLMPKTYEHGACDAVEVFCDDAAGLDLDQASAVLELFYRKKTPTRVACDRFSDSAGATLPASFNSQAATFLCRSDALSVAAIASSGGVAVLVPQIAIRDQDSQMPLIDDMRASGVKIAISTEAGPDATGDLNIVSAARLGITRYGLTPVEAVRAITTNAAEALGAAAEIGTIATGKRGDLVLVEAKHPEDIFQGDAAHSLNTICAGDIKDG